VEQLDRIRQSPGKELPTHLAAECLKRYLMGFVIAEHIVPGLGPDDRRALMLLGIKTADQLYPSSISRPPGLPPDLQRRLVTWRRSIETFFVDRANRANDAHRRVLEAVLSEKEEALLTSLREGLATLKAHQDGVLLRRAAVAAEMAKAQEALVLAMTELARA
jgi:DNA-binding helix-hairpin-helix protein with protein kinase domain